MRRELMIGATLLALASCGRGGGQAERQGAQGPANVTIAAPANITIAATDGRAEVRTGGALSGLPQGIPAYPGAEANASVNVTGASAEGQGGIHGFRTGDPPSQVINFYADAAGRAGYGIANQMSMGATAALTARRGEGEILNVTATQAGGATQVQIIATGAGR